jgi:hypothetical protein
MLAVTAGAPAAPGTTEPARIYPVTVTLTEKAIRIDRPVIPFQSTGQFRIRNTTRANRIFTIGGQRVVVRAKGGRIFLLILDTRGYFPYASIGPKGTQPVRGVVKVV